MNLSYRASFSSCGLYRWSLERNLNNGNRVMLFIGLNPSKANSNKDDPTLKRLMSFCKCWGYGKLIVVNLFARIGQSPIILKKSIDPVGELNDQEISLKMKIWSKSAEWDLWLGWGSKGTFLSRNVEVMRLLKSQSIDRSSFFPKANGPLALGLTKDGHPLHPLYVSSKEVLKPFDWHNYAL